MSRDAPGRPRAPTAGPGPAARIEAGPRADPRPAPPAAGAAGPPRAGSRDALLHAEDGHEITGRVAGEVDAAQMAQRADPLEGSAGITGAQQLGRDHEVAHAVARGLGEHRVGVLSGDEHPLK